MASEWCHQNVCGINLMPPTGKLRLLNAIASAIELPVLWQRGSPPRSPSEELRVVLMRSVKTTKELLVSLRDQVSLRRYHRNLQRNVAGATANSVQLSELIKAEVTRPENGKEVINIMATTISFVVGKGSLSHNNRSFVAENVVEERIELDEFYIQEPLEEAYKKVFGQAVEEYNLAQKRNDRKIDDYITKIKNSKNNEKVFYENVVQIGRMTDFGVCDENGNITENALKAKEVLDEYVKTFQKRNPNLYLFNAALHMDEATPHLHLDYFPVAHGYKKGMKTRNSLTKALQEMGIEKATSRNDNETMHWQTRERNYLTELCAEKGIEIEVLGVDRDDYTIPEYKAVMKAKDEAEAEIEILNAEKAELSQNIQQAYNNLAAKDSELDDREEKLKEIDEKLALAQKKKEDSEKLAEEIAGDDKKVDAELAKIKKEVVDLPNLFGGPQMVKIPKKSFDKLIKMSKAGAGLKNLSARYNEELEKKSDTIQKLRNTINSLTAKIQNYENFIDIKGLAAAFREFLHPSKKSVRDNLSYFKDHIDEYNTPKKVINSKKHSMER